MTTNPTFDNAPEDETVACADGAVPTVTASDNCEDSDSEARPTMTARRPI